MPGTRPRHVFQLTTGQMFLGKQLKRHPVDNIEQGLFKRLSSRSKLMLFEFKSHVVFSHVFGSASLEFIIDIGEAGMKNPKP